MEEIPENKSRGADAIRLEFAIDQLLSGTHAMAYNNIRYPALMERHFGSAECAIGDAYDRTCAWTGTLDELLQHEANGTLKDFVDRLIVEGLLTGDIKGG